MSVEQLRALFAGGHAPDDLTGLTGDPTGRMLAVKHLDGGAMLRGLRTLAAARAFPWGGKSFSARSPQQGDGINRVHLGPGGRHQLFPFKTHIGPSAIDGAPAVVLDYDLPDNPAFIRAIHDEVRLIAEGLYLGPAMWKTERKKSFVLWFALDTALQAQPIGERESS